MNTTKKVTALLAAAAGLGAAGFAFSPPASAQGPLPPAPPMARPHRGDRDDRRGERHPEIRRALRNLQQAKGNLQNAARDFSGHREQALDLVQRAIDQCQQALQADKR